MATSSPSATGGGYMGFNLNPGSMGGNGAYGAVPGMITAPPSIFSQVNNSVPGAAGLASGAATNIASQEGGILSPGTQNLLQNNAAAMGINLGLPGGLPGNTITNQNQLTNMGLTSEGLAQTGDQAYLSFLGGVGGAQLNPSLLTDIAQSNATLASAPDPTKAAEQQQANLLQMYGLGKGPTQVDPNWWNTGAGSEAGAKALGGGEAFLPAGSTTWKPGSGFQGGPV